MTARQYRRTALIYTFCTALAGLQLLIDQSGVQFANVVAVVTACISFLCCLLSEPRDP